MLDANGLLEGKTALGLRAAAEAGIKRCKA
jgi:hypothetical protein